jgi:hypothetical protein
LFSEEYHHANNDPAPLPHGYNALSFAMDRTEFFFGADEPCQFLERVLEDAGLLINLPGFQEDNPPVY